jgi:hypothetical protein
MTVSWYDVALCLAGLCLAVWIAIKIDDFVACEDCDSDCNQGRNCKKDRL